MSNFSIECFTANRHGRVDGASNTFKLDNRGTQNGGISVIGLVGAITAANSGTVTGGIDLRSAGAIDFTNSGVISTNRFGDALILNSLSNRSTTGADGITRSVQTGGGVTATIGGTVGLSGANGVFQPQSVNIGGGGPVDVTITGTAGFVSSQSGRGTTDQGVTSTSANGVTTTTQLFDTRVGSVNARVTVAASGRVSGVSPSSAGETTAIIDGAVAPASGSGGFVTVNANGVDRVSRSTFIAGSTGSNQTFTQVITNRAAPRSSTFPRPGA